MRFMLRLNAFYIYNLLLIFIFSFIVNSNNSFSLIYTSLYCVFHFLIIYLGIYYYRNALYFIFFLYGLGLDVLWLNEIGPHLIVFMFMLVFFNLTKINTRQHALFKRFELLLMKSCSNSPARLNKVLAL